MEKWNVIEGIKWFLKELGEKVDCDWYSLDLNSLLVVSYDLNVRYCNMKFSQSLRTEVP